MPPRRAHFGADLLASKNFFANTHGTKIFREVAGNTEKDKKNLHPQAKVQESLVPPAGIEPARYRYRGILSPLRLPVPPWRRSFIIAERAASVKPRLSRRECAQNSGRRVQIACVRLKIASGQYRIIGQERFASKFCVLTRRGFAAILSYCKKSQQSQGTKFPQSAAALIVRCCLNLY